MYVGAADASQQAVKQIQNKLVKERWGGGINLWRNVWHKRCPAVVATTTIITVTATKTTPTPPQDCDMQTIATGTAPTSLRQDDMDCAVGVYVCWWAKPGQVSFSYFLVPVKVNSSVAVQHFNSELNEP